MYEFVARDGSVIEEFAHMSKPPRVGSKRRRNGKTYTRVLSVGGGVKCVDYAHEAVCFPKGMPNAPHYSKDGYPEFHTQREIANFAARYPRMKYDG